MELVHLNIGEPVYSVVATLLGILFLVLVLPLVSRRIEENLEPFFLLMGVVATASIYFAGILPGEELPKLVMNALLAPVMLHGLPVGITQVVLVAGLIFYYYSKSIYHGIGRLLARLGVSCFIFVIVALLGLVSSIMSVIVAAVVYSEILAALPLSKDRKVEIAVLGAFALGMGAALTPVGEPLATIVVHKLSAPPYNARFDFLVRALGDLVIPGVIGVAAYTAIHAARRAGVRVDASAIESLEYEETLKGIVMRAVRVYIFVAALELLGTSFTPLIEWYFSKIPPYIIYWVNMVSAIVDNATLAAAEIGPFLHLSQIRSALMGLLISGGMLIPGNIPNIIIASRLKIKSKEWAKVGVPFGIILLTIYFIVMVVTGEI